MTQPTNPRRARAAVAVLILALGLACDRDRQTPVRLDAGSRPLPCHLPSWPPAKDPCRSATDHAEHRQRFFRVLAFGAGSSRVVMRASSLNHSRSSMRSSMTKIGFAPG